MHANPSIGQQAKMQTAFANAFNKLATIGHNPANLVDCSDVIPNAPPLPANAGPHLPAGQTQKNIEQAVSCQGHRLLLIDANIG
jgi:cytochrome c peroxidase